MGQLISASLVPHPLLVYVWSSITYSRVCINRGRLQILLVVSYSGKMNISLFPFAPESLVSRDGFGRPVPRQPTHSTNFGGILRLLTGSLPISAVASIYLDQHTPSGKPRVYRVTRLRADGVHCRESVGIKVVRVTDAAFAGHHGPIDMHLSFPTLTIGIKWL